MTKPKVSSKSRGSEPRESAAASSRSLSKPIAKGRPGDEGASRTKALKSRKVVLLSGGNPQIAKADGNAPVAAYIAAMPGWKRDIGKRLDELIGRNVPGVRKAVKWNTPFYGIEGNGFFLAFHTCKRYVKVAFFRGASLRPVPPEPSTSKEARYLHIHEGDELDEAQMKSWLKQAAALPDGFLSRSS